MCQRRCSVLSLCCSLAVLRAAGVAQAQAQVPVPVPVPDAVAAMERARRMADNPMRLILEAGKGQRKAADAQPLTPADTPGARAATAKGNAAAAEAAEAAAQAGRDDALAAQRVAALRGAAAAAREATLSADGLEGGSVPGEVPALVMEAARAPTQALSAALGSALAPLAALAPMAQEPRLLTMVEPQIAPRLLLDLGRTLEVLAELSIRPDGSVSKVDFVPPLPRPLQRAVQEALEQWRFEPLPGAQVHRVQMVLKP